MCAWVSPCNGISFHFLHSAWGRLWSESLLFGQLVFCWQVVLPRVITLDQHYQWTDWSHRLVRLGYAGIIYN